MNKSKLYKEKRHRGLVIAFENDRKYDVRDLQVHKWHNYFNLSCASLIQILMMLVVSKR